MSVPVMLAAGTGILIIIYLLSIKPAKAGRISNNLRKTCYFAHRGLHDNGSDAPENSLRAFERAVLAGYGIEMDVRLTRDGIPVIFHDSSLERMCGSEGCVEDMSYEELRKYRLLGTDQRIPAFGDVLRLVAGRVPLLIEYKMDGSDASVCICAERLLKNYQGYYCIESFHPFVLFWYRHNRPNIFRGILSTDYSSARAGKMSVLHFLSRHLLFNFFTKPDFIAYDCRVEKEISRSICRCLYKSCLAAWTVKSREQLEHIRREYDWFIFEGFHPQK